LYSINATDSQGLLYLLSVCHRIQKRSSLSNTRQRSICSPGYHQSLLTISDTFQLPSTNHQIAMTNFRIAPQISLSPSAKTFSACNSQQFGKTVEQSKNLQPDCSIQYIMITGNCDIRWHHSQPISDTL